MTWPRGRSGNPGGQSYGERLLREMESLVTPTTLDSAQPMDLQGEGPLTASFVADFLGVGRSRVHQLDDVLKPERGACGYWIVLQLEAIFAKRAQRKADK